MENGPVHIKALTWNMGNKQASVKAVNDLYAQLAPEGASLPVVIGLSTQEELAPTGKRLQDKLLRKLNAGLPADEQYVLVKTKEPQYHTTTAGANNSKKTFTLATATSQNRVSMAVLVKKPYQLTGAKARIDYEPGKEKGGNKSVITISGELTQPNQPSINIAIAGGHFDSNSDQKRRAHTNVFLEKEGLKKQTAKNFEAIYQEASAFKIVMGDFNERDRLMKDGSTQDPAGQTNLHAFGFDMHTAPEQQLVTPEGIEKIHGTYGFAYDGNHQQINNTPDPRARKNVAKGGT